MPDFIEIRRARCAADIALPALLLLLACGGARVEALAQSTATINTAAQTPSQTVLEFYKALREKRFRDAFARSVYKPAIETLSAEEFAELRPDFENIAAGVPVNVEISGEQISADTATVFLKIKDAETAKSAPAEPLTLIRSVGGAWIIGDRDSEKQVKQDGKEFFLKLRIQTHQDEARAVLQRISLAELAYSAQHNGAFADLQTLIAAELVPKDVESPDSTGYVFQLNLAKGARNFAAFATPARYNRTGRLSFYLDASGMRSKDNGGKMFRPDSNKP